MHKMAKQIAECLKAKIEDMGIDNITGNDLTELGMWTDIIKDMACYDKDMRIIEAMDKSEHSEESMKYIEAFEEYPEHKQSHDKSSMARREYMEIKEMHKGNTPEEKQMKMRELEKYIHHLGNDITDMMVDSSPEEKAMFKNKMQSLISKM